MFIPSGGGQWAVQGPIMIEAALSLDVNPSVVVLGVAYGDQWSNMIQPFLDNTDTCYCWDFICAKYWGIHLLYS